MLYDYIVSGGGGRRHNRYVNSSDRLAIRDRFSKTRCTAGKHRDEDEAAGKSRDEATQINKFEDEKRQ
jgi:hypothetical protein